MTLGVTGLICLSIAEYMVLQNRYHEVPVWSHTPPNKTVVQVWENKLTGSSTIVYLNKIGRVCVLDIGQGKPSKETEKKRDG